MGPDCIYYLDGRKLTYKEFISELSGNHELLKKYVPASSTETPNGPLKKTWHEMAFKKALRDAVESGADKIAWVTGEIAADRFDISKQVDTIRYEKNKDGTYNLFAEKDGVDAIEKSNIPENSLPDYVGKDIAQKIALGEHTSKDEDGFYLSGLDLKVGGSGMKGFYDKILPDFARKYVKPWGGKVETTELYTKDDHTVGFSVKEKDGSFFVEKDGENQYSAKSKEDALDWIDYHITSKRKPQDITKLHSITITPEMRKSVMEGQSMFMPKAKKGALMEEESASSYKTKKAPKKGALDEEKNLIAVHNVTADKLEKAIKLGGLAVPSIAILKKDAPHSGFGEISLIGDRGLIDPKADKGNKVYESDIYSVRHPKPTHDIDVKAVKALQKEFEGIRSDWGSLSQDEPYDVTKWARKGEEGNKEDMREKMERSLMFKIAFAAEKTGGKFEAKQIPRTLYDSSIGNTKAFREYAEGAEKFPDLFSNPESPEAKEFIKAVKAGHKEYLESLPDEAREMLGRSSRYFDADGEIKAGSATHLVNDAEGIKSKRTQRDSSEARDTAEKYVKENEAAFKDWVDDKLDPIFGGPTIKVKGKKQYYNLENIVEAMFRKDPRAHEAVHGGTGIARAKGARRFNSVDDIREAQDRIVSSEAFSEAKKAFDAIFHEAAEATHKDENGGFFGHLDDVASSIGDFLAANGTDAGTMKWALKKNYIKTDKLDESDIEKMVVAAKALQAMPTEYFEAKLHRGVKISEFKAAVVPEDAPQSVLKHLTESGLDVETYKGSEDRARAIKVVTDRNAVAFMPKEESSSYKTKGALMETPEPAERIKMDNSEITKGPGMLFMPDKKKGALSE